MNAFDAASAAIDAVFEEPVVYTGGGLPAAATVPVIWIEDPAPAFMGAGATARKVSCEIRQAGLPSRPAKADRIARAGRVWAPIDVTDLDDIGKWLVTLERQA